VEQKQYMKRKFIKMVRRNERIIQTDG